MFIYIYIHKYTNSSTDLFFSIGTEGFGDLVKPLNKGSGAVAPETIAAQRFSVIGLT